MADTLVSDQVLLGDVTKLSVVVVAKTARKFLLQGSLAIAKRPTAAILSLTACASTVGLGGPACVVEALVCP